VTQLLHFHRPPGDCQATQAAGWSTCQHRAAAINGCYRQTDSSTSHTAMYDHSSVLLLWLVQLQPQTNRAAACQPRTAAINKKQHTWHDNGTRHRPARSKNSWTVGQRWPRPNTQPASRPILIFRAAHAKSDQLCSTVSPWQARAKVWDNRCPHSSSQPDRHSCDRRHAHSLKTSHSSSQLIRAAAAAAAHDEADPESCAVRKHSTTQCEGCAAAMEAAAATCCCCCN